MNITPDLPFLSIHNPFTNERMRYNWTNIIACLPTQWITLLQISHLSKGVVITYPQRNVNSRLHVQQGIRPIIEVKFHQILSSDVRGVAFTIISDGRTERRTGAKCDARHHFMAVTKKRKCNL